MTIRGVLLSRKNLAYFFGATFKAPCYRCGRRWRWKKCTEHSFGPYGRAPVRHYCCDREGLAR